VALPPAIQQFGIQAGEYLAGLDSMIARTDQLAGSLDGTVPAADAAQGAIDAQAAAYARAAKAAGLMIDAQGRLRNANGQYASSAQRAAVEADAEAGGWDRSAAAADRAGVAAAGAGTKTKAAGVEASGFGSAMKTAFLGVAVAAVYGVDQAAKFQSSMEQLHTQAGVAQDKIKGLSQGVLQLAGQVGEGPQSLSESLYHVASNMASTGASGAQMLSAVKVAAEGAQVGNANLVDVTNALGAAIASGIPGVANYTQAMGYMNATVGAGDMKMQDLADAFGTGVLANIKLYGVTLQDVSAALATLGDNNIRGAVAGTDLRVAVQAMIKPAATAKTELADLGLKTTSFATAMKNGGLNGALQLLVTHMKAAGVSAKDQGQVITDLFGKKAGSGIGVLVGEFDRFKGKYADVKKGADQFAGDWNARTKTMSQQWNDLKSGAQALAISFGTILLPAATKVVGALAKFATFLEKHPALAAFAGAILAVAVAFKVVAAAEALFNVVTDANPVMLVILAVIALAAGLYELYKHSKLVRDIVADVGHFFAGVWRSAMEAAGAVIKWFTHGPLVLIKQQIAVFRQWWQQNGAEVMQVWHAVWGVISSVALTAWRILSTFLRLGLSLFKDEWRVAWGIIRDVLALVWNVMAQVVRTAFHIIGDIIAIFLDVITGHWSKAWHDVKKLFSDAIHGVESIASAWGKGLVRLFEDLGKNVVHGLINGIKSMFGAAGSVMSDLGSGIKGAFKSVMHMASPSKVMYELGVLTGQGLTEGITYSSLGAYNAAKKTAQNVGLLFQANLVSGLEGTASKVGSTIAKMLSAVQSELNTGLISQGQATGLTSYLERDNARLQALATQRASIAKTIAAAKSYAASTTSNTEQAFGVMNAAGSTPMTAGDIAGALRQDVSQIVAFKNNIQKLAKMGLNKAYINQLIQAGPVSGGQVAAELAAGSWAQIRQVNSAESAIASASTSLGYTAANAMYDSGKAAGNGFMSGLRAQQESIVLMMKKLAEAAVQTMKRELKISSPSQVFMDHGRQVVAGFVLGLEGGTGQVGQAVKTLAGAASMPHGGIAGIGAGGGGATFNVHLTVNGFVGNKQELVQELGYELQHFFLQTAHRNPTNGLSLASGR
jgi:TP901 family phage tail tape measure protein